MNTWPPQHRALLAIIGVALLAFGVVYVVFIRPKQQEVAGLQAQMETLRTDLLQKGWPLDSSRLTSMNDEKAKATQRFVKTSDDVLKDATGMFEPKIVSQFETSDNFRTNASRLDYKEEFSQAEKHLRERGLTLGEEVLKLSETSDSPYTYQLVLQLWTLEALTDLALDHGLRPAVAPRVRTENESGSTAISRLTVLPMKAYVSYPEEKEPYLLEFPVQMVLVGNLENLCDFLRALHGPYSLPAPPGGNPEIVPARNFFPVSRLEVHKAIPLYGQPATPDQIEADIQCSSFYRWRVGVARPAEAATRTLPAGG